jgi:hypothetical protein
MNTDLFNKITTPIYVKNDITPFEKENGMTVEVLVQIQKETNYKLALHWCNFINANTTEDVMRVINEKAELEIAKTSIEYSDIIYIYQLMLHILKEEKPI